MSVITAINHENKRDWESFNKDLHYYGFHRSHCSIASFTCMDNNRLSRDELNKNSSIIYQKNFNSLLTFLPTEIVEKILNYGTYKFPMINVYKEMILYSKTYIEAFNPVLNTRNRYAEHNLQRSIHTFQSFTEDKEWCKFKSTKAILYQMGWRIRDQLKHFNKAYLFKQLKSHTKNVDGILLHIIKWEQKHEQQLEDQYDEPIPDIVKPTAQDILMDMKRMLMYEWNYFAEMLFHIVIQIPRIRVWFKSEHKSKNDERERLTPDAFGRWLDYKKLCPYNDEDKIGGFTTRFLKWETKAVLLLDLQKDLDDNGIPLKLVKSWSKNKIIKMWLEEGREIFLQQHKKKFKKVLKQYIGKIIHKFVNITAEEEEQRFHPQTRIGECAGCISICEECERLLF